MKKWVRKSIRVDSKTWDLLKKSAQQRGIKLYKFHDDALRDYLEIERKRIKEEEWLND